MNTANELKKHLEQMEQDKSLDALDMLKICNGYVLAISLLNSAPSKEHLEYVKSLIPAMNLPEYLNTILNNIILEKINN